MEPTASCDADGSVTGTATFDDPNGDPVNVDSGTVYVNPVWAPGQPVGTITNGQFTTTVPLAAGDYRLRFEGPPGSGLVLAADDNLGNPIPEYTGPWTVTAGPTTDIGDVQLEQHASIWGTIVDENGDPVAGHVGYCAKEGAPSNPAGCDGVFLGTDDVGPDGVFQLTALAPAYYRMWADYGYPPGGGYTPDLVFELSPGTVVRCDFVVGDTPGAGSATCDDGDGVDESGLPPGYDGNADGTADAEQANVATFPNAIDQQYVTIATPEGTLANVAALDPAGLATAPPEGASLPFGAFTFEVHGLAEGASVDVELFLPATPTVDAYFKYHDDSLGPVRRSVLRGRSDGHLDLDRRWCG